jgi:hypothetical protein
MDQRERAAFESRLQNEDELVRLLEGEDTASQQLLADIRGWTPEQLKRLRHFAHERRKAIDICQAEYKTRRLQTPELRVPEMTDEEKELSVHWEHIEPQVRGAVRALIKKGYAPTYSGFNGLDGNQIIKVENVDVS